MKEPYYQFQPDETLFQYYFESISEDKTIKKAVIFSSLDESLSIYNVALVDILADETFSDLSVSNNQDMPRILATVFRIMALFVERNPNANLLIQGSTPSRTRLYQMAISKYVSELEPTFLILGLQGNEINQFERGQSYNGFIVSKR